MGNRIGESLTVISGEVALDAAADVYTFAPGRPIRIYRMGYIWTSATTTAPESLVIQLDKRITIGSDTGRTASQAQISGAAGEAIGGGSYGDFATPVDIDADEEVVVQVSTQATAGDGYVFLEYVPQPFVDQNATPNLGSFVSKTIVQP